MRFIASSRASLLLVATAAALCLPSALAHITVEDNFVDDAVREDILAQLPEQTRFKHTLDLPGQLYQRILSVLHPSNTDLSLTETSVPTRGEGRFVSAHKDVFEDRSTVEGPVGLIYLEGDGRMLFQHEVTGEETVVDVRPGRLLSWDNSIYTHTLIPGDMPRRFLGPMAFRDGGMQSIGGPAPAPTPAPSPAPTPAPSPGVSVIAQAYTNTLSVSAGRIIRVTLNFMVLGMNPTRERTVRKLEDLDLVIGCVILDQELRALGAHNKTNNANDNIAFKSSKLKPNFFKPKLTATETVEGGLEWTLPSETTKILHPYKITWVVRVGKGAPSVQSYRRGEDAPRTRYFGV
ncbi:hypothetical protein VYU27_004758 [Nannochloropsis oceanica]